MWYPKNKLFSTERFDSNNTGEYLYTSYQSQNNLGGMVSLRNIATGNNVVIPPGAPWPAISWDSLSNFSLLWNANSGSWTQQLNAPKPAENFAYGTVGVTGNGRILTPSAFNFTTGVLIEASVYIPRLTGLMTGTYNNYYGILIQDSNKNYETIRFQTNPNPGFILGSNTSYETFIPSTNLVNGVVSFRYAVRDTTGHFITQDGYSVLLTGYTRLHQDFSLPTALNGGVFGIGSLTDLFTGVNTDRTSRIDVGRFNFKSPVYDIAGDFIADTLYSVNPQTFTLSPLSLNIIPDSFRSAVVKLGGTTNGCAGTTIVNVYYSSSLTNSTLVGTASYTEVNAGVLNQIPLTYIATAKDGSDTITCTIVQNSTNGLKPPPPVDYVTITISEDTNTKLIDLKPRFGSANGQYPILLSIDPQYDGYKRIVTKTTNEAFLCNLTGELATHVDIASGLTVNGHYLSTGTVPLLSGVYGNPVQNWRNIYKYQTPYEALFTGLYGSVIDGLNYKRRPVGGNGYLLASPNFTYLYSASDMSGAATGNLGYSLNLYSITGAYSNTAYLDISMIQYQDLSGSLKNYVAQSYIGPAAYGFITPETYVTMPNGTTHIVVENIIQVSDGRLGIALSGFTFNNGISSIPTYSKQAFSTPQRVRSIYPVSTVYTGTTASGNIRIAYYGIGENLTSNQSTQSSAFSVANTKIYSAKLANASSAASINLPSITSITCDGWVNMDGYNSTGVYLSKTIFSTEGIKLAVSKDGYPILELTYTDDLDAINTIYLTGVNALNTTQWHHLATEYDQSNLRYELWLDGKYQGALAVPNIATNISHAMPASVSIGDGLIGAAQGIRIRPTGYKPDYMQVFDSQVAPLKFHSEYQLPLTGAIARFKFDKGGFIDYSSSKNHLLVPDTGNALNWTTNDTEGVFGEYAGFLGEYGKAYSYNSLVGSYPNLYLAFYLASVPTTNTPNILNVGNFNIDLLSGKYIRCSYSGVYNFTGRTDISTNFGWGWFSLDFYNNGTNAFLTGYYRTGQIGIKDPTIEFSGSMPAGNCSFNNRILIGHTSNRVNDIGDIFLDDLGIYSGRLPSRYWPDITSGKGKHNEYVRFNNSILVEDKINNVGVYDKEIIVPPLTGYNERDYIGRLAVNITNIGEIKIIPTFSYVGIRSVTPDLETKHRLEESRDRLCKTNSPFRIGTMSPANAVNLAYINTPDLSVETNLSIIDGSDSNAENFVNAFSAYNLLSPIVNNPTGDQTVSYYTGQVNTDDLLITNYAMTRKDANFVAPLFFKHLLGHSKYYLYQIGITGSTNTEIKTIRDSIKLLDDTNSIIPIESYPYDIRVSKSKVDGRALPTGVYSVELLTRDRYIEGKTIFVEYVAADPLNNYIPIKGYREVINPIPIYIHLDRDKSEVTESFRTIDSDVMPDLSSRRYNVGPTIIVNQQTGTWSPTLHNNILHKDDIRF